MKNFKSYIIVWILLIGLFNICCFVTPSEINGISKYEAGFWPAYGFVMLAFMLHLAFAYYLFSEKNEVKRRQNTSLSVISFLELAVMIIAGALCMLIPSVPYWVAIIVCYAVLAFSVILLVSTKTVEDKKYAANNSLNTKTANMRELADNAQELISMAKTAETKSLATKVFEAIKYSDTVSSDETYTEEKAIFEGISEFKGFLNEGASLEELKQKADEILMLIEQRNNIAKASKRRV